MNDAAAVDGGADAAVLGGEKDTGVAAAAVDGGVGVGAGGDPLANLDPSLNIGGAAAVYYEDC